MHVLERKLRCDERKPEQFELDRGLHQDDKQTKGEAGSDVGGP